MTSGTTPRLLLHSVTKTASTILVAVFVSALGASDAAPDDAARLRVDDATRAEGDTNVTLTFGVTLEHPFSLSRFGVTWTMDAEPAHGLFANGDPWVVGPVNVIGITPASQKIGDRTINGSMLNPDPNDNLKQGFDNGLWGIYEPPGAGYLDAYNVALGISAEHPLTITTGSLVSSISRDEFQVRPQLELAAVLTVLSEAPPADGFRPPYCGTDKSVIFRKSQLDFSKLARLPIVSSTPSLAETEAHFEYLWLDHVPNWLEERLSHARMPGYGRDKAGWYGVGTLLANQDFSDEEKETLVVRLVQIGIDYYGTTRLRDDIWINNGGHASGRLWPILFAGILLGDTGMQSIRDDPALWFGEIDQTFYVSQAEVDMTHSTAWAPNETNGPAIPYEVADIGLPEWGIEHRNRPEHDNKAWTAYYRTSDTGKAWSGQALSSHIMGCSGLWQHPVFFEYVDRYVATETSWGNQFYGGADGYTAVMWNTYRGDY